MELASLIGGKPWRCAVLGKAEGVGENWHGHVTALTVAPEYRRLGLARQLMNLLEDVSEKMCVVCLCACV